MKYCAKHILKGSLEEVLEIVMDRSRDPRVYPNITSLEQTKHHETDKEIFCEFVVRGDGDIPKSLRLLATPKLLTWVETGHWDKKRNSYSYVLRPHHFANIVRAGGMMRFTQLDGDAVLREFEAEMCIDIPFLGVLAAKTIASYQLDNYRREEMMFERYIEECRDRRNSLCSV